MTDLPRDWTRIRARMIVKRHTNQTVASMVRFKVHVMHGKKTPKGQPHPTMCDGAVY